MSPIGQQVVTTTNTAQYRLEVHLQKMGGCKPAALTDPAILGYYQYNGCYNCPFPIKCFCCTKQWTAPGEGCNRKEFDVHEWEPGTQLRTEFESLLVSVYHLLYTFCQSLTHLLSHFHKLRAQFPPQQRQMQEVMDNAPKHCTGCLGGCASRYAQGAAINKHFCSMVRNEHFLHF